MRSAAICCLIFFITCLTFIDAQKCPSDKNKDWSWDPDAPNGPKHWGDKYPDCNGKKQSPINIKKKDVKQKENSNGIQLTNYDKEVTKATIRNVGYLLIIEPTDGVKRYVTVDDTTYNLREFHFHWGHEDELYGQSYSKPGSEHELNNRKMTMEGHFVHYSEKNQSLIIAVWLGEAGFPNPVFEKIVSSSEQFQYAGDVTQVSFNETEGIRLDFILPNGCPYYTYEGSNSLPPCSEGVTWMICNKMSFIESAQIFRLEQLNSVKQDDKNVDKCFMEDLYRPVQPLNGRTVYAG